MNTAPTYKEISTLTIAVLEWGLANNYLCYLLSHTAVHIKSMLQ